MKPQCTCISFYIVGVHSPLPCSVLYCYWMSPSHHRPIYKALRIPLAEKKLPGATASPNHQPQSESPDMKGNPGLEEAAAPTEALTPPSLEMGTSPQSVYTTASSASSSAHQLSTPTSLKSTAGNCAAPDSTLMGKGKGTADEVALDKSSSPCMHEEDQPQLQEKDIKGMRKEEDEGGSEQQLKAPGAAASASKCSNAGAAHTTMPQAPDAPFQICPETPLQTPPVSTTPCSSSSHGTAAMSATGVELTLTTPSTWPTCSSRGTSTSIGSLCRQEEEDSVMLEAMPELPESLLGTAVESDQQQQHQDGDSGCVTPSLLPPKSPAPGASGTGGRAPASALSSSGGSCSGGGVKTCDLPDSLGLYPNAKTAHGDTIDKSDALFISGNHEEMLALLNALPSSLLSWMIVRTKPCPDPCPSHLLCILITVCLSLCHPLYTSLYTSLHTPLTLTHTHIHTLSLTHTHTHTLPLSISLSLSLSHTHTHTHSRSLSSLSPPPYLSPSPSLPPLSISPSLPLPIRVPKSARRGLCVSPTRAAIRDPLLHIHVREAFIRPPRASAAPARSCMGPWSHQTFWRASWSSRSE